MKCIFSFSKKMRLARGNPLHHSGISRSMFYLLYVSRETHKMTSKELREILAVARERNGQLGISGLLLYKNGRFMQFLEGPEDAVRSLMNKVSVDQRHQDVMVLQEDIAESRQFPTWGMAFNCMDDPLLDPEIQSIEHNEPMYSEPLQSSKAVQLMQFFNVYS